MSEIQSKFPSEVIDLPSKGLLYPTDHPLASGTIEIKYMTAREEDILSSTTLVQKGTVLDKLVESIIMTEGVHIDDIISGDKSAIILATRIMAYGNEYNVSVTCPNCYEKNSVVIDLAQIEAKDVKFQADNKNNFDFELPSGTNITYKYLTHKDERNIEESMKVDEKIRGKSDVNHRRSTEYRYIITSVEGDHNPTNIRKFVDDRLVVRDSRALISHIQKNEPEMDTTFDFKCTKCDHTDRLEVPIDFSFFWPPIEL